MTHSHKAKSMRSGINWIILALSLILLGGCTSGNRKPDVAHTFCPVTVLYQADGTENVTHFAVERVCLQALQKRLDAAYGE